MLPYGIYQTSLKHSVYFWLKSGQLESWLLRVGKSTDCGFQLPPCLSPTCLMFSSFVRQEGRPLLSVCLFRSQASKVLCPWYKIFTIHATNVFIVGKLTLRADIQTLQYSELLFAILFGTHGYYLQYHYVSTSTDACSFSGPISVNVSQLELTLHSMCSLVCLIPYVPMEAPAARDLFKTIYPLKLSFLSYSHSFIHFV